MQVELIDWLYGHRQTDSDQLEQEIKHRSGVTQTGRLLGSQTGKQAVRQAESQSVKQVRQVVK